MFEPLMEWRDLKNRSDIHLARKIWHLTTVSMMFFIFEAASYQVSTVLLAIGFALFISVDFLRQKSERLNQFSVTLMGPLMRDQELKGIAGTTYLLTGVLLIVLIFPKPIVSLSILFLAFADPIASYVGIRYGKDKILGGKTIQGFLAAFVVCLVLAFIYLNSSGLSLSRHLVVSIIAGLIGAFAELLPIAKLDDNLTMPVLSALGLSVLFYLFNITDQLTMISP